MSVKEVLSNAVVALLAVSAIGMVSIRIYDRVRQQPTGSPETHHISNWREVGKVGYRIGSPDALVTIVEFSDFQCPVCKRAWEGLSEIRRRYPDTVSVVFRNFPLPMHESALGAAHGAQCAAEQGAFDSYQKLLYSSQELFGRQSWVEYARKAGVTDIGKFGACMTNTTTMAIVERDRADGKRLGINGTPAFLINDLQVSGYQDVDELESMVRAALRSSPQRMARR